MRWCAGDARPPEGLHWTRRPGVIALQAFQRPGWTDPARNPARMGLPLAVYNQVQLQATFARFTVASFAGAIDYTRDNPMYALNSYSALAALATRIRGQHRLDAVTCGAQQGSAAPRGLGGQQQRRNCAVVLIISTVKEQASTPEGAAPCR